MTPAEHTCPECGASLPADAVRGICPRCLLRRALEADPAGSASHATDRTIHLVLPQDAATGAPFPFLELGDYELIAEIGRGGMGIIYQARQRSLDRVVAIKLIRSGALARPEDIARFRNEAAAAARLKHPHIVAIHEVGEQDGHHFYSMDFVPGRSLSAVLREGPFTPKRAAQCVRTVAEAIHYAHEHGVLHRDLKPSNILIDAEDEPHVADFGLAKLLHSDSELTLTGAVLGSPNYMPPEQARGKHAEVSARSDVYSLGAILYESLTGRPPFTAATPLETMKLVVEQEPVSPRVLNPSLPRDLETICLKCLAKEPAHRYPTAQELADELGRFLADEPIRARPAGFVERAARWCRRKPAVAALFTVIATSAVVLVAVLVSSNTRVRHALDHAVSEGERASNALIRAQSETRRAETNAELNRLNLYAARMYLADRALKEGNTYQAHRTLEELRPREGETDLRGFEWHLLWKAASGEQAAIWSGHSNAVLCLALSPDGNTLASGGMDAQIRLWDAETGAERGVTNTAYRPEQTGIGVVDFVVGLSLPGAPKVVRSVEFTRDGGLLVAGCGSSMFLKSTTLERVFSHDGERSAASRLLPESSLLVGIELAERSTLRVYDWRNTSVGRLGASAPSILAGVAGLKLERTLTNLPPVFAVSPRGAHWASCTWSNDLLIWRQAEPTPIQSRRTSALATALAFSPDGKRLAVATAKPELEIHQLAGPQPPARFALPGRAQALGWSPDGRRLAAAGKDQTVSVWDSVTGKLERRFVGHLGPVNAVIFSQDGRRLFSGGDDGSIRVWELDAASGELLITNGWSPYVFSPDGRQIVGRLVARTRDHGRVCRWDADTGAKAVLSDRTSVPAFFTGHGMEMGAFTYQGSNQSLRVDFMLPDGTASRPSNWIEGRSGTPSRPSAKLPLTLLNAFSTPGPVYQRSIAFSSTGKLCAVSYSDCLVEIWNPAEGRRLAEFDSLNVWPAEPRFSADLRWLAFRATHHWEVWNLGEQKRVIRKEQKTGSTFHSPVFTTQPSVMYFGGEGADIRRVDLRTGEDLPSLVGHAEKVVALALSPDERTLASGGSDQEIKFWHVASGREVASRRLEQGVLWLEFSPDNQRLAVLEANQSLRLLHAPKAK